MDQSTQRGPGDPGLDVSSADTSLAKRIDLLTAEIASKDIAALKEAVIREHVLELLAKEPELIIKALLREIGEDPTREGLLETPRRVIKGWKEWAAGYNGEDPHDLLKVFEDGAEGSNELVIVSNIPIQSKCEHHLADITGIAHIGYIPNGKIVGLSKLARLADLYARRLQVQERLTVQIADALQDCLEPIGVGVVIRAGHACMSSRGVKVHGSITTTSAMRGALLEKPEARAEFLQLCRDAERGARQ